MKDRFKSKFFEFFTRQGGRPTDASLHELILAAGNHEKVQAIGRAAAKRAGLTDEEITLLYPKSDC